MGTYHIARSDKSKPIFLGRFELETSVYVTTKKGEKQQQIKL